MQLIVGDLLRWNSDWNSESDCGDVDGEVEEDLLKIIIFKLR